MIGLLEKMNSKWQAKHRQVHVAKNKIWAYLLICFSLAVLSCSLMHYLVWVIHSSDLCTYLCPTLLSTEPLKLPYLLKQGFALQSSIMELGVKTLGVSDGQLKVVWARLFFAPILEEIVYRGPLFLVKDMKARGLWYGLAVLSCLLFVLSHNSSGLSYLPLAILGVGSTWLIVKTGRFWPCVLLHFLYNFQVVSRPFYNAFMWGD